MRYEILGPVRVVDAGGVSHISARKVEALFAALLIRADQVVRAEQLIGEIWVDGAPRRANAGLHVYVSQLRKFLHRDGRTDPIVTRLPGYLLDTGGDELDVRTFLDLVEAGRVALRDGRPEQAAARLERALDLWRGPVLGDLPRGILSEGFATWLMEERLQCLEMLVDARLQIGRHRELVGRLYALTTEHPLHEAFYRQLMLALYRSDRQAEALHVYQNARQTLKVELGLEPCRALQELQRAILVADDRLSVLPAA